MTEPSIIPLRIPIPFSEGRIQVYVIDCEPITLIDTGTATDRSFNALVSQLDKHGLTIRDIGRVILTHKHIDHIGNAWRIQQASNAEILIHESEMQAVADVDSHVAECVTTESARKAKHHDRRQSLDLDLARLHRAVVVRHEGHR